MPPDQPRVSVVLSAYNRSAVMRCAIESVRRQTFSDWELLVVGDACTDDSAEVVASFGDPRIAFFNLAENHGEQSAANNAGFALARGEVIAFLNQDDLWFPDHLERTLHCMEETKADAVFALAARVRPDGKELLGVAANGRYSRYVFAPASTLVFRRHVLEEVGPWRDHREMHRHPTQDLLLRAHALSKEMRLLPHVTVLAIPAGLRPGSYMTGDASENQNYLERMRDPNRLRLELLEEIALAYAVPLLHDPGFKFVGRTAARLFRDGLTAAGIDAWSLDSIVRYGRRPGSLVESRRKVKMSREA